MEEFCVLRAKTYVYLINGYDDDYEKNKIINKGKAKGTKKCVIKRRLMFENYKDCLFNDKIMLKTQQRFKSYLHEVYTEKVNKTALSSNDDKRSQISDSVTTYPYGRNALKVTKSEMLKVCEAKGKLKMLSEMIGVCEAKALSKECEREMYVKEKGKYEICF